MIALLVIATMAVIALGTRPRVPVDRAIRALIQEQTNKERAAIEMIEAQIQTAVWNGRDSIRFAPGMNTATRDTVADALMARGYTVARNADNSVTVSWGRFTKGESV